MGDERNVSDALIKLLIQGSGVPLRQLGFGPVKQWLNVELPRTQSRRVDLLGKLSDGRLLHIELQSTNDRTMPFRMAEYALAIMRRYGGYPVQLLIYVGIPKLRMTPEFRTDGMLCWYWQVDIRSLDAVALMESGRIEDNILAVFAGLKDSAEGIRRILMRIAKLRKPLREPAPQQLLLTCGLRGLGEVYERESKKMPIVMDLSKDPLFARYFERERRQGRKEGMALVRRKEREGRTEAFREVVRQLLEKRFGRLPPRLARRVGKLSDAEAKKLALAIIDARSLKELFAS